MSSENSQNGKRTTTSPIGYKKNVVLSRNGSTATHKDTLKDNKLDFPLRFTKIFNEVQGPCQTRKKSNEINCSKCKTKITVISQKIQIMVVGQRHSIKYI